MRARSLYAGVAWAGRGSSMAMARMQDNTEAPNAHLPAVWDGTYLVWDGTGWYGMVWDGMGWYGATQDHSNWPVLSVTAP
eukprot:364821-Chlamydomonas_euryale.AAC.14